MINDKCIKRYTSNPHELSYVKLRMIYRHVFSLNVFNLETFKIVVVAVSQVQEFVFFTNCFFASSGTCRLIVICVFTVYIFYPTLMTHTNDITSSHKMCIATLGMSKSNYQ